jgi:lipoyl(octanoyl) transferase
LAVTNPVPTHDQRVPDQALLAYLLGALEFDAVLAFQRRLVYEIGGDRSAGAMIVCDHPPGITIGREGSRAHVRLGPDELEARGWSIRWVGRGGGTMLHVPGQVACYPILPLEVIGRTVAGYVEGLQAVVVDLLRDFQLSGTSDRDRPAVCINGRRVAHFGVAVRDNVTSFGMIVNVEPDLELFRAVRCDGDPRPMTSIQREAAGRVRITSVRQRLVELVAARFGFGRVSVFHSAADTLAPAIRQAFAQRS